MAEGPGMVGRVVDPAALPGGAALVLKAARKAGAGWWCWATQGVTVKPVKTVSAAEGPDGRAVYEDREFGRTLVKGRSGRRAFVVEYVDGKAGAAWIRTTRHAGTVDGQRVEWTSPEPTFEPATVTEVKAYLSVE